MELQVLMTRLFVASCETIFHRSCMMLAGRCSVAEYQLMVTEKVAAMQQAAIATATGQGPDAALRPFLKAASRNARRLRSK
jgi:hypothetical protein